MKQAIASTESLVGMSMDYPILIHGGFSKNDFMAIKMRMNNAIEEGYKWFAMERKTFATLDNKGFFIGKRRLSADGLSPYFDFKVFSVK